MICPSCYGPSRISKTLDNGTEVVRLHECMSRECDRIWTTDQKLRPGTLRENRRVVTQREDIYAISNRRARQGDVRSAVPPPTDVHQPLATSESRGGVGGGLPSGTDPSGLGSDPSWHSAQEESRAITRPSVPVPFAPPSRMARVGAVSLPFLRCYDRYPNPFRKLQAAQTWGELADSFPGGEKGLADSICAAFDAGMLEHKPYNGDAVPKFETVLAERLWEERPALGAAPKIAESFAQRDERTRREAAERTRASLHRDVAQTAETLTTCPVHLYGPREDRKCNKRCPMWEGVPIPSDPIRTLAESKTVANG